MMPITMRAESVSYSLMNEEFLLLLDIVRARLFVVSLMANRKILFIRVIEYDRGKQYNNFFYTSVKNKKRVLR